jgi:hypothetical protein
MDDRIPPLSYAPDGLYESDVDALLAEYFGPDHDQSDATAEPSLVADRATAHRLTRRVSRQSISAALRSIRVNSPGKDTGEAA